MQDAKQPYKFFGKTVNTFPERILRKFFSFLKFKFQVDNYEFSGFDYDPDLYFIFELDLNFSGYGSYKTSDTYTEYERSVLHIVLFRTKFSIRKKWRVSK